MKRFWMGLALIAAGLALAGCNPYDIGGGGATSTDSLDGSGTFNGPWIAEIGTAYKGTIGVGTDPLSTTGGGQWFRYVSEATAFYEGALTGTNGESDLAWGAFEDSDGDGIWYLIGDGCDVGFTGDEICTSTTTIPSGLVVMLEIFNFGPTSSDYRFKMTEE